MKDPRTHVKRVAGTDFHSSNAAALYECSTELRELLAVLTPKRAGDMVTEWCDLYGRGKTRPAGHNGRTQMRLEIIKNLAALAVQGNDRQTKLVLRVDYRKRR